MQDGGLRFGRWLLAATGLGAVIRVAWLADRWNDPIGFEDAFFYHHQANLLADGKGFISPFPFLSAGLHLPAAEHPPLYSLYLAIWSAAGATSVGWHQLATTLVGIGTVALIGLAGREAAGPRLGVVAAFVAAVYPHLWYQDGIVWAEAIAQACVALFVLVAFRYVNRPSARNLATVGLAAALASMARTELIVLLPLGVVGLALLTAGVDARRRLGWVAAAGAIGIVAIAPWIALNLGRFDRTTTLSSNVGLTLASANCDSTWYGSRLGYWSFWCAQAAGTTETLGGGDPSEVDALARRQALDYIGAHRGRLPAVVAARVGRATGLWRPWQQVAFDGIEGRPHWIAAAGLGTWWAAMVLAAGGVVTLRRHRVPTFPLLATIAAAAFGILTAFATTRYRATAEPAMALLAAAGALGALERLPIPWPGRRRQAGAARP